MPYLIRTTDDVLAVRDRLFPIWAANLPVRGEPDDRLRWFYCDSPHGRGATVLLESPQVANAAIGTAGVGVRTLWYRGRKLRAALFADLAIDRAHRSGFPALSLLRAVKKQTQSAFDLGYGLPNAAAAPVYRRAGYVELGQRVRYVRVLRWAPTLRSRIQSPIIARAAASVIESMVGRLDRFRTSLLLDRMALAWIPRFDARFDALWQESTHLAPVLCERTAAFLQWRFTRHPGAYYRIVGVHEKATGELRAYAVIRDNGGVAEIADMFGATCADLDALLTLLVPDLTMRGFRMVSIQLMVPQWVQHLLMRHWFVQRQDARSVSLVVGDAMQDTPEIADREAWYMTDLDEDA